MNPIVNSNLPLKQLKDVINKSFQSIKQCSQLCPGLPFNMTFYKQDKQLDINFPF